MIIRYVDIALQNWRDLDGWSLTHGVGPLGELTLSRFASLVWHWATLDREPNDRLQIEARIWQPPPGVAGRGVWSAEAEMAAFGALELALA